MIIWNDISTDTVEQWKSTWKRLYLLIRTDTGSPDEYHWYICDRQMRELAGGKAKVVNQAMYMIDVLVELYEDY